MRSKPFGEKGQCFVRGDATVKLSSFDVFDTLLTRVTGSPSTLYLLLGRRLMKEGIIGCSAEGFAHARRNAQQRAWENAGRGEITLQQIYAELGYSLRLSEEQCQRVLEAECALEEELLRPVPGVQQRVSEARTRGDRIAFVSDMYLPSEFIQRQLAKHRLWEEGDLLLVSCEYGKCKSSGALFGELLRQGNCRPALVSHCGNHAHADLRSARNVGFAVDPFPTGNLNRYEELLEAYAAPTEGLSSLMGGASRLARLSTPTASEKDEAIRDVAAGVAAPMLAGYVLWILQRAQQLDLKRLYFVSRDGHILVQIARRLAPALSVDCELRYLYGSRQAWHLAGITQEIDEAKLEWILDDTPQVSVRSWLRRLSIDPEEVRSLLLRFGLDERQWSRHLKLEERTVLRELLENGKLRQIIKERAAEKRVMVTKYLEQEGLLDCSRWGLVDIGWQAKCQDSLADILAVAGALPPIGFYFGLNGGSSGEQFGVREAYMYDRRFDLGFYPTQRANPYILMEVFCAAPHGSVVGYREEQGQVVPVLGEGGNQENLLWGLPLMQQTICRFTDNLSSCLATANPFADVRAATLKTMRTFLETPTVQEASAWGEFSIRDEQAGDFRCHIARAYSPKHDIRRLFTSEADPRSARLWSQGSLAISPLPIRFLFRTLTEVRRSWIRAVRRLSEAAGRRLWKSPSWQ